MHSKGRRSNHPSVRQQLALPPKQLNNPTIPTGFLSLILPPLPCAALLITDYRYLRYILTMGYQLLPQAQPTYNLSDLLIIQLANQGKHLGWTQHRRMPELSCYNHLVSYALFPVLSPVSNVPWTLCALDSKRYQGAIIASRPLANSAASLVLRASGSSTLPKKVGNPTP